MSIKNVEILKTELADKIKELYFMSETDAPITVIEFYGVTDIAETLKKQHPDKTDQLVEADFNEFYDKYAGEKEGGNDYQKNFAKKFKASLDLLTANLKDVKVFRLGNIRIDIYIIGKYPDGRYIGLKTLSVET